MADKPDLSEAIARTAAEPKSYENDGEKMVNHSLPELIAADKHLARRRAARNPFGAIKVTRISTQGPSK